MDIYSSYATDPQKEVEGSLVALEPGKPGKVLVARLGNRNYSRLLTDKIEANKEALAKKDKVADDLSDQIMAETLAETVLLGWDEDISYKGQAYSKEVARQALMHGDFRKRVMERAGEFENFRVEAEKAQGNV